MVDDFELQETIKRAEDAGWKVITNDEDWIEFKLDRGNGEYWLQSYNKKTNLLYKYNSEKPIEFKNA